MTGPGAAGRTAPSEAGAPRVVVAVLTYRRPGDLLALLPLLVTQVAALESRGRVLVVDNDPAASAQDVVEAAAGAVRVDYAHEPAPGIAAARNRALDEAAGEDLLVFIDDDERPGPDWLEVLLAAHAREGATAVVGPVVSAYEHEPEGWIRDGAFFERRRLPTGTEVDVAATNNLLLDLRHLRASGIRFDERFGLSGGSDTLFTRQVVRSGGRMVWCDEAGVVDVVPAARLTRRWVLRRAYRSGNSWSRTSLELARPGRERLAVRLDCSLRGAVRMGAGALRWCVGVVARSQAHRARGLRTVMRGAGLVSGAWGSVYAEYRRPHGS